MIKNIKIYAGFFYINIVIFLLSIFTTKVNAETKIIAKSDDNLLKISKQYGVPLKELMYKNNINDEEHKNNVADILHLSIANHYSIIVKNSKVILAYLDDMNGNSLLSEELNSWILKLGYSPNTLKYKEIIVDTLYKHEKYYLDK